MMKKRAEAFKGLKELILQGSKGKYKYPVFQNGRVFCTGIINTEQSYLGFVTQTTGDKSLEGFQERISLDTYSRVFTKSIIGIGFLTFKDFETNDIYFIRIEDKEIMDYINSKGYTIFTLLDRLVIQSSKLQLEELHIDRVVYGRKFDEKGEHEIQSDTDLHFFTSKNVKDHLLVDASIYANRPLTSLSKTQQYEYHVDIQGIEIQLMSWLEDNQRQITMRMMKTVEEVDSRIPELLASKEGTIVFNRDLVSSLPSLVGDISGSRRIVYVDLEGQVNRQGRASLASLETTSLLELRNRNYDIYVINLDKITDMEDLLNLPSNKLVILVAPTDTHTKAMNYLYTFRHNPILMNHLVGNLIGVISELDDLMLISGWGRNLILENEDVNHLINLLETPFIIRDNVDLSKRITVPDELQRMLQDAMNRGIPNIDIGPGSPIRFYKGRVDYETYSDIRMTPQLTEIMSLNMMGPESVTDMYETGQADLAYSVPGVGRYRVGIMMQRGSYALSIRSIVNDLPSIEALRLPESFIRGSIEQTSGITMMVGEPHSGKTFTFNAIIDMINREYGGIIILMGNPIEQTHRHAKALIHQIEIGKDMESYSAGIAKALRMNTSVVGFEELRTTAEYDALGNMLATPNRIFMTAHAASVTKGIENLVSRLVETGIDVSKAREDVANSLNYVIHQILIRNKNGEPILIYDLCKVTSPIKALIRNGNFNQINAEMGTSKECETMDEVIMKRLEANELEIDDVKDFIKSPIVFNRKGYKL